MNLSMAPYCPCQPFATAYSLFARSYSLPTMTAEQRAWFVKTHIHAPIDAGQIIYLQNEHGRCLATWTRLKAKELQRLSDQGEGAWLYGIQYEKTDHPGFLWVMEVICDPKVKARHYAPALRHYLVALGIGRSGESVFWNRGGRRYGRTKLKLHEGE